MRIVTQVHCSALSGLIFLCFTSANNAIAQDTSATYDQLHRTSTAVESKSPQKITRTVSDEWVPPDIDAAQPPVADGVACSLRDVASKVGSRIEKFFANLNRLTAIETIQHQTVSKSGTLHPSEIQKIDYVASVEPTAGGYLSLKEYRGRDLGHSSEQFLDHIELLGAFSPAVIFHPNYAKDFQMTCEGLGSWRGKPAWLVRFEELPDNRHHFASLAMEGKIYYLKLRGRAWILSDSYELARLETDLVQPIPEVRLRLQHQVIEYSPGNLSNTDGVIWLPSSVEMYMDFRGHRFYRHQSYTDFQLFSIKVHQEFGNIRE